MATPDVYPIETRQIGSARHDLAESWPGAAPVLVFLHEGLGSVAGWSDFPDQLCAQTGLAGLIYSRRGYGRSAALAGPFGPDFLHESASGELNRILADHKIASAILVGHSDGASIALIRGGQKTGKTKLAGETKTPTRLDGIIAIAPHLFVEPVCIEAIKAVAARVADDPGRLAFMHKHHDDAVAIFRAWSQAWLDPAFSQLDLLPAAARITCPVLAVQGEQDQYGTLEQIHQLARTAPDARAVVLPACRHAPHLEAAPALLRACVAFIAGLPTPQR